MLTLSPPVSNSFSFHPLYPRYWARAVKISTKTFQRHFLATWEAYLHGTAQQAEDRCRSHIRDVDSYIDVRRRTIGARPSFNILEMAMDIPDAVLLHPVIQELELLAIDLTIIANVSLHFPPTSSSNEFVTP
jgi:hypothetical protein